MGLSQAITDDVDEFVERGADATGGIETLCKSQFQLVTECRQRCRAVVCVHDKQMDRVGSDVEHS